MAANGGRRACILATRIRFSMSEILGSKGQSRLGSSSDPSTSSEIGVFKSQGRIDFGTKLRRPGMPSTNAGAWRTFEADSQCGRGLLVRNASTTHESPEPASKEAGVHEAGQEQQQTKTDKEEASTSSEEKEEVVDEKTKTLRAALLHVPQLGWTEAAITAGARDVGLSPAFAGAFPSKEAALLEFFMDECTQALVEELESQEEELGKLVMQDRIATIVWTRLQMQVPYLPKWAQALSIQAQPVNLPTTIKQRALLMDEIWHAAGDRSTDMDWYTKRAILAGVYSTTELYMLTDISPGFRDTQAFLERRISDALDCRKTAQEAGHLAQAIGAGLQKTFNSFLNRKPGPGFG